jgi:hypothetical protein
MPCFKRRSYSGLGSCVPSGKVEFGGRTWFDPVEGVSSGWAKRRAHECCFLGTNGGFQGTQKLQRHGGLSSGLIRTSAHEQNRKGFRGETPNLPGRWSLERREGTSLRRHQFRAPRCVGARPVAAVEFVLSPNVQRETTFPQGMSRRQAALPFC